MKLRAPSIPLFNVDPYFSIWSKTDVLTDSAPVHWTGSPNTLYGIAEIDGVEYRFMGEGSQNALKQTNLDITALSTAYTFAGAGIKLAITFTSPRIPDDFYWLSSPVSYMAACYTPTDGKTHTVTIKFTVTEELCLDKKGQAPVVCEKVFFDNLNCVRMGNAEQKVLNRSGDDVRIDWGYVYLAVNGHNTCAYHDENTISACAELACGKKTLFVLAYDDIYSLVYFGKKLRSYWNKDGEKIETAIERAMAAYDDFLFAKCREFSDKLFCYATRAGGEKYAEMLELAWRQVMAAHKVAVDGNGDVLFVSKECFSNGCAATVDVSYPSIPMFLLYAPELVLGMMRPIFQYAESDVWPFDFAPHDAGQYPILNGQVYSNGTDPKWQMPLEECGNMLVMAATSAIAKGNADYAACHYDTLKKWADYLKAHGTDPEHQLCTDDFAGHLAHNCNLTLKAVMGLASFSIINNMLGKCCEAGEYMNAAREMAATWVKTAANGDGSYKLAFDRQGTYSMKYNAVWDKLFGTELFPKEVIASEVSSNFSRMNPYGMPLDNRAKYTKSDWLVWTATLAESRRDFERYIEPLWNAYNCSRSRVPMTDWYDTVTGDMVGFQHRTVQGGLYIKLLEYSNKMSVSLK